MPAEPPAKKAKKSQEENDKDVKPDIKPDIKPGTSDVEKDFFTTIIERRELTAKSVLKFSFNKKRVRVLSDAKDCPDNIEGVLYWMSRDQRVQDNWALLFAQRYALKLEVPLHVGFCLVPGVEDTLRHFGFMMKGLQEVEQDCRELDISFHLFIGEPGEEIPKFATANKIGAIVTDFSPLREPLAWVDDVKKELSSDIPFCQVDAHNVVPCWEASPKLEYGARTIRPKITKLLSTYMTEFPPVIRHPHKASVKAEAVDWDGADSSLKIDRDIKEVDWATPGTNAGLINLEQFIKEKLRHFNSDRNDPNKCALSNMSPWYHFGQVSVQRAMLMVKQKRSKFSASVDAYIEEGVVRRELADNFCYYNENYDNIEGTNEWAKKTLKDHKNDKREYVYSKEQLENGKTHDDLWNASQIQLLTEGKMHGFLRMYWAKKILEWTESPEQALDIAIYLNDRYSLDGRDPNGFVGCMWSICGIHDQGWAERPVFGKIRFMNYNGCKRKFDVATFVRKYKAKPVMGGKSIAAAFQKGKK